MGVPPTSTKTKGTPVAKPMQSYLFSWKHIETSSDLDRLQLVLASLPDEEIVSALEKKRGNGRNDYPVRPVWNAILAGIVFQHPSIEALRRELMRNAELRDLCGFNPLVGIRAVPSDSNFSRFLASLLKLDNLVEAMFHQLVEDLRQLIPELGRHQAMDGKAIHSHSAPQSKETRQKKLQNQSNGTLKADRRREDDADFGVKTYKGVRRDGSSWEKTKSWFGFELHLLVDSQFEMPLNYEVTKASVAESPRLIPLVADTEKRHPKLMKEVCAELSADKGYDSADNVSKLWDTYSIRPYIDCRKFTKDGDTSWPLDPSVTDTIMYDQEGLVSCICPATWEKRSLSFWGFEKDRQSLKYRCPAVANDFPCQGRASCKGSEGSYGRVVRIPLEKDRRLFTPTPRSSEVWKKSYARRSAVERVNSRIDNVFGFENHTIRGLKKMKVRMGLALSVMLAMALGRTKIGQKRALRSLLEPVKAAAMAIAV